MKLASETRCEVWKNREVDSVCEVELMQLSNKISCNLVVVRMKWRCYTSGRHEPEIYSIAQFLLVPICECLRLLSHSLCQYLLANFGLLQVIVFFFCFEGMFNHDSYTIFEWHERTS